MQIQYPARLLQRKALHINSFYILCNIFLTATCGCRVFYYPIVCFLFHTLLSRKLAICFNLQRGGFISGVMCFRETVMLKE